MKAPAILLPKEPLPDLHEPPIHMESYQKGFRDGFQDGFAADLSTPGVVLCGSGLLALLIACIVVMRHASRVVNILCQRFQVDVSKKSASQKLAGLVLPLLLCAGLTGCAFRQGEVVNPAPVSPEITNAPKPADGVTKEGAFTPYDASYREDGSGQYLAVHIPADPASGPRHGDPAELAGLLKMTGTATGKEKTAVQLMRPKAIREAARLITFQTAMSWRYGQLVAETERYSAVMDTAFNFAPLMLTQGEALIMPPLLTRAGASMRIEDNATATAAKTTYELLEPARYIAVVPNWREFLMANRRARSLGTGAGRSRPALCRQCVPHGAELSRRHALSPAHRPTSHEPGQYRVRRPGDAPIRQRQQAEHRPEGLPDYRAFRVHGRARRVPEERRKIAWGQRFLPA